MVISLTASGRIRGMLWSGVQGMSGLSPPASLVVVIATATVVVRLRLEQWQLPDIRSLLYARQCAKGF